MIKIACASPSGAPCSIKKNTDEIIRLIRVLNKADIILFPRLAISASSCGDMFLQSALTEASQKAVKNIASNVKNQLVIIGLPVKSGAVLLDAAAVLYEGKLRRFVPMPGPVKPFGESFPGVSNGVPVSGAPFEWKGNAVCVGGVLKGAVCLIPSCRPYLAGDEAKICGWLKKSSENAVIALAQSGRAESSTDFCFGGVCGVARGGRITAYRGAFSSEDYCFYDGGEEEIEEPILKSEPFSDERTPYLNGDKALVLRDLARIPSYALALRLKRIGAENMVLGLSGGLDSAMALLTADRARRMLNLGVESLNVYTLPAQGTGKNTLSNARMLCGALNVPLKTIDISEAVLSHLASISHSGKEDAAFENAQARERTQVLMDIANMVNGVMIGTGDMSELALGFTTYGGDHMSMYGVNSGLLKTMIRLAVRNEAQENKNLRPALEAVLKTPVSPELKSGAQRTEEILGPYILNDFFLYFFLKGAAPEIIIEKALSAFNGEYSKELIKYRLKLFYKRFFYSQFKRSCLPDGPKVINLSLSPRAGLSMPSDASPEIFLGLI